MTSLKNISRMVIKKPVSFLLQGLFRLLKLTTRQVIIPTDYPAVIANII